MLVVTDSAIRLVVEAVVNAARSCTDAAGNRAQIGTMEPKALNTAAMMAISIATGEPVWPASEPIRLSPARRTSALNVVEQG